VKIFERKEGQILVIIVSGRLDHAAAESFREYALRRLNEGARSSLVDFGGTSMSGGTMPSNSPLVCYPAGVAPSPALKMGGDPPRDAGSPALASLPTRKRFSYVLCRQKLFPNLTGSRRSETQKLFRFGYFGIPLL
jgi:hypothetical protein